MSGNVQALDEPAPDDSGVTLPYVVMLDQPLKRLISVPSDHNNCVRADVCFGAWPHAHQDAWFEPFFKAAARKAPMKRPKLRFAVGDCVACLTAGSDGAGLDWPRRWSAGTVLELWHRQAGVPEGSAVPYAVALTPQHMQQEQQQPQVVLVHQDDHQLVRLLEVQPPDECPSGTALSRFTTRDQEPGWIEKIDQQTLRKRKVKQQVSSSDEEDSLCDGFVAAKGGPSDTV